MNARPVILVHDGEPGSIRRIRDVLAPTVAASSLFRPAGVWSLGDEEAGERLASELSLPHVVEPDLDERTYVIGRLDPETVLDTPALGSAGRVALEGFYDATLDQVERLRALAYAPRLHPLSPWRRHAAVAALATSVAGGRFGLLHAVHAEMLAGREEGPPGRDSLAHLTAGVLEVIADLVPGPLPASLQRVHAVECGTTWVVSGVWRSGCIFSALIGAPREGVAETLHRYRILGSHGQAYVDLASPGMTLFGQTTRQLRFTTGPLQRQMEQIHGGAGPTLNNLAALAPTMDMVRTSISRGQPVQAS